MLRTRRTKVLLLPWFVLSIALIASPVHAGPDHDIALQFLGITTTINGAAASNFVNLPATNGQIARIFSGNAQSYAVAPAIVSGWGPYQSNSDATSVSWDARFRVNQPDITVQIDLGFLDFGRAISSGYAYASGHSTVNLMLNGVSQLTDSQRTSCNTFVFECQSIAPNEGHVSIVLEHMLVGQILSISGLLSGDASATAGPICGDPYYSVSTCLGLGFGFSSATFTIWDIPEPSSLPLLGTGLVLGAVVMRRRGTHRA